MGEHGRPMFNDVFVKRDASPSIAEKACQRGLAFEKRASAQS
jgi:hypothetical protein